MWSVMNGSVMKVSVINVVCFDHGRSWTWSLMNKFCCERYGLWTCFVMNGSEINVVCHECGRLWTWSVMNVLCYECGLLWLWPVMTIFCYECGLLWNTSIMIVVCYELLCNERVCNQGGLLWRWSVKKGGLLRGVVCNERWSVMSEVCSERGL